MFRSASRCSRLLQNPKARNTVHYRSSSQYFRNHRHTLRCAHTRDRPASVELGKENSLSLDVKQYIPKDNPDPQPNDVSLIGAHANAFPKEIYEPLWDDLYEALKAQGRNIRNIWIADQYNQGYSGMMNSDRLGPDPSWWDHGRDLMYFINQFQDDIPHPIIGVGHSMGGTQLTHLALMHPRLLDALVLIDPVIQTENPSRPYALASTYRRDLWPAREEAEKGFKSSKFYQKWDPRALQCWIEHGLTENLGEQYSEDHLSNDTSSNPHVTLTTTKAQEVYNFLRPAYQEDRLLFARSREEEVHPDDIDDFPMYRPEPAIIFRDLERLAVNTLYIFGETSDLSKPEARKQKIDATGVGPGGSGGKAAGKVEEVVLDCGHLVPMERPQDCATAIAGFVGRRLKEYEAIAARRKAKWDSMTRAQKVQINDKWKAHVGDPPKRRRKSD